ncbi:MAG: hypothetical protein WA882_10145 [Geitlerinemataceae cyanobacterium]
MTRKTPPSIPEKLSGKLNIDSLKQKLNLSGETRFWGMVVGLLIAPIVLTYLVFGFFSFSPVILGLLFKGIILIFLLATIGLIFFLVPTLIAWEVVKTIQVMVKSGFNEGIALAVPISVVVLGISLGGALQAGSLYPLWLMLAGAVAIPLSIMVVYIPVRRALQVRQYRLSQQHLIKP